MRFAVGYQLAEPGEESFVDIVRDYREHVSEVYFPWIGAASGRSPIGGRNGVIEPEARARFEDDLIALRELGVKLNVLFNANCYGGRGMSRDLEREVVGVLKSLDQLAGGADAITTTSPAIAHIVKQHQPRIDTRASVNMRIGSVEGMQYLADVFDSYHVCRDFNRDLDHLRRLKRWADGAGKRLHLLANSGCLRNCSGQTFHDNLVAHEDDVAQSDNLPGYVPYVCWRLLRHRQNWPVILQATWVRPEDLHHYADLFDEVKLATRLHERPHVVIGAYARGRHEGNLLDLLEPGFGRAVAPHVLDNRRFPGNWFERTSTCGRHCETCGYCAETLDRVLVNVFGTAS